VTTLDFQALLPLIILAAGAGFLLLLISFVRNFTAAFLFTAGIQVAAIALFFYPCKLMPHRIEPLFTVDGFGLFYMGLILFASLAITVFAFDYFRKLDDNREEFFVLLLMSTLGAGCLAISDHFISFFLGLELLSVPLYAMAAYTLRHNESLEAGIKYLLLAAASSAFLLFGMALIYTEAGSMGFSEVSHHVALTAGIMDTGIILAGLAFIFAGVAFKLSLAPFHWWTPDVYQGAPLPVTTYLATVSKASVIAVALRLASELDVFAFPSVFLGLSVVIFLSIILGNLLALGQSNLKRLLAYSSIAHMGYLMIAFLVGGEAGTEAAGIYLAGYLLTSLGTFGILSALSSSEYEINTMNDIRGLYWERPVMAGLMTLFMLSLAGIPLTAGFMGKFFVLTAGAGDLEAMLPLLLTLIGGSVIGLFYYLRVIWALFQLIDESQPSSEYSPHYRLALVTLCVVSLGILTVGILPSPLIELLGALP